MGSLIQFLECKKISTDMKIHGVVNRLFLEEKLDLVTKYNMNGSSCRFDEAMNLSGKIPNNLMLSTTNENMLFIFATLRIPSKDH